MSKYFIFIFSLTLTFSCMHRQDQVDAQLQGQSRELTDIHNKLNGFSDKLEAKQEIFEDLAKRVKIERADMQVMLQDIRIEIQGMRGEVEELKHRQDRIEVGLARLEGELNDKRLDDATAQDETNDVAFYDRTLKMILEEKDYDQAITRFDTFLAKFPKSGLADNATYWTGEALLAKGEFKKSILKFQEVNEKFPDSDKVCGAVLKQGIAFERLEQPDKAKLFFEEVLSRCKEKPESETAKAHLKQLKPPTS